MTQLVDTVADVIENLRTLDRYSRGSNKEREFHRKLIKNGKLFVYVEIGLSDCFAPSRFAGYFQNNSSHSMQRDKDGRATNHRLDRVLGRYIDKGAVGYAALDAKYEAYCKKFKIIPSRHYKSRRYWRIDSGAISRDVMLIHGEILDPPSLFEGGTVKVIVDRYERSLAARQACIEHHGSVCAACGFDFELQYGRLGAGYIHVHHIRPLSKRGRRYKVNPVRDLRPLCPNCHSMVHREMPPISVGRLKKLLSERDRRKT